MFAGLLQHTFLKLYLDPLWTKICFMFTANPTKWICEPKLFSSDAVRFINTNAITLRKIGLPFENAKKYTLDTDVLDANTMLYLS